MKSSGFIVAVPILLACVAAGPVRGSDEDPQEKPPPLKSSVSEHVEVQLVELKVTVTDRQGNPVSGDFSVGIRVGYKIERGEIVGLVKDAMLAGNVFTALNNVVAISTETENAFGWYAGHYPYIQVDGLNVVAR